jgi:uncharacterized glyoxalase superfamily protein PhnB
MKFGYTILYVPDVPATLAFYGAAFGLETRFLHPEGDYGELETGATALAFVSEALRDQNGVVARDNRPGEPAAGVEIALVTEDVAGAFAKALEAGAAEVIPVAKKPWGQHVGYVRDLNGVLVELCSPMG